MASSLILGPFDLLDPTSPWRRPAGSAAGESRGKFAFCSRPECCGPSHPANRYTGACRAAERVGCIAER